METTTPYGFKKPGGSDFVSPDPFNDNMDLLNAWFPVGSIREFTTNVDPNTFMGGTWTPVNGVFLFAHDSEHPAGSYGGEADHELTVDELAPHVHQIRYSRNVESSGYPPLGNLQLSGASESACLPAGGGQPHNNMPPYRSVYVWERTA